MQVKHWSSFRYSARSEPLTKVTVLSSIMSLSWDVHAALAGTHSPRNSAATPHPVMVCEVGKANTAMAKDEMAIRLIERFLMILMGLNIVARFSFITQRSNLTPRIGGPRDVYHRWFVGSIRQ